MTADFEFNTVPTFRDLQGRFATASQELSESRRDLMRELARDYVDLAQSEAPGGTGHTVANQIGYQTFASGESVGFRTTLGQVARWQSTGTGLYGPHQSPIVPVKASVLHFFIQGQEFFRRSVRGVRPNAFLGRAYRRWLPGAREGLRRISLRYVATIKGESRGGVS